MPFEEGIEFLFFAEEEEAEEKIYMRWVIGYQSMIPFNEFKKMLGHIKTEDKRTEKEILDEVKDILG